MKVFLFTGFLLALLPAVASRMCFKCQGKIECQNPKKQTCAENEDICVNNKVTTTRGDGSVSTVSMSKYCGSSQNFTSNMTMTVKNNTIVTDKLDICQEDLCNGQNFNTPRLIQIKKNGRECPYCTSHWTTSCNGTIFVPCYNHETKCIYTRKMPRTAGDYGIEFAHRDCGTPEQCNKKQPEDDNSVTQVSCTDAPMAASALEGHARASRPPRRLPFMRMKPEAQDPQKK